VPAYLSAVDGHDHRMRATSFRGLNYIDCLWQLVRYFESHAAHGMDKKEELLWRTTRTH